ncbi:uncharacterized protein LOC125646000 isoform X2 [Ostrea edulis]|uniref:uncharacterized protein LOC125646000 isoform X2 n=1 Tax=Ostrea edulis TaxID=37623 RepID=UPI0024AF1F55|nr:uncharacterized protein LOC125646000 isoform X2 [Ostrea edulis]
MYSLPLKSKQWLVSDPITFVDQIFPETASPLFDANVCTGTCDDKIYDIQTGCKEYDDRVTKYETELDSSHNNTNLCRSLVDFLLCVGNIAPVCLDKIIEVKSPYFHSPHDCHFSDEEYSEIQRYKSCKHLHQSTTASSITYPTLPSRTYESNASSVTFQTSRPTNQQHKESNSSRNLHFSHETFVISVLLFFAAGLEYQS